MLEGRADPSDNDAEYRKVQVPAKGSYYQLVKPNKLG